MWIDFRAVARFSLHLSMSASERHQIATVSIPQELGEMEKTRLDARAYIKNTNNEDLDRFEAEVNDEIVTLPVLQTELSSPDAHDLSVVRTIIFRSLIQKLTNTEK